MERTKKILSLLSNYDRDLSTKLATPVLMRKLIDNKKEGYTLGRTGVYFLDYKTPEGDRGTIYFTVGSNNVVLIDRSIETVYPPLAVVINTMSINTAL